MGTIVAFVLVWLLGGLTLPPLLLAAVFLHAHLTLPIRDDADAESAERSSLVRPDDDPDAVKKNTDGLAEARWGSHENDVAAGYFAVCREYIPGGINGKPPERTTPAGQATVVSAPSPSVYQSMYRSIFDRKQSASPLDNKGSGRPVRRGGNVFYVVLRMGHLMLYDSDEMVEVRYVISLAHHHISLYGGDEGPIPEGELFIKRNAICLSRTSDTGEMSVGSTSAKPFFLFSENCSEKEDFYMTLLRNQENPPTPLQFDVNHVVRLVQTLHSSEEHLQTRWLNALLGRIFLGLYKTSKVEDFIRAKITKKIARVKTPSFLSGIKLRHISLGEGAPYITNPKMRHLGVDGECLVEADFSYTGNVRVEVATTARIELGSRFKAREVNLVLAVVLKRLEGHVLLKIKPPPSNRIWFTFETNPHMECTISPIVSARQITYGIILRQIESRIKEVFAESVVFPNWDDSAWYNTEGEEWRGGIFAPSTASTPEDLTEQVAQEGNVDEVQRMEELDGSKEAQEAIPVDEVGSSSSSVYSRKTARSVFSFSKNAASSSSLNSAKTSGTDKPRAIRTGSYASASTPVVGTDNTNADAFKPSSPEHSHAASGLAAISARSRTNSQSDLPTPSPFETPTNRSQNHHVDDEGGLGISGLTKPGSFSSTSSHGSSNEKEPTSSTVGKKPSLAELSLSSVPPNPASTSASSLVSVETDKPFSKGSRQSTTSTVASGVSSSSGEKRTSVAALSNAAATAKKWGLGLGALARGNKENASRSNGPAHLREPMGRGQPIPPGVMAAPPGRSKTAPITVPKRKPIPPPVLPPQDQAVPYQESLEGRSKNAPPLPYRPPLPKLDAKAEGGNVDSNPDGMLVVAAPESEPTTPREDRSMQRYLQPWVEDEASEEKESVADSESGPELPKRQTSYGRAASGSPEDHSKLPSWMAGQEEEARLKSVWVSTDEDSGV